MHEQDRGPADQPGAANPGPDPAGRAEDEIRSVVERLSRRHPSGGRVIERAAILAEGARSTAIMAWITSHAWEPEEPEPAGGAGRGHRGLHSERRREEDRADPRPPQRYVLRPDADAQRAGRAARR